MQKIIHDDFITVAEAASIIPKRRGKKVHTSTLIRWGKQGKITLYVSNGYRLSRSEIEARFAIRPAFQRSIPVALPPRKPSRSPVP